MPPEKDLKTFEFGIQINKAWVNKETGKHFVKGIASDTGVDHHKERFSDKALEGMVSCIKNSNPADVILLPTHWDTFEIGKAVNATIVPSENGDEIKALEVEIELDMEYPQAKSLYKEVESGKAQKQMSVGGFLNPENDKPYFWEEKSYDQEDGNVLYDYILVLDDLVLDHIAVTRKDKAANARTGFSEAIAKSLDLERPKPKIVKSIEEDDKMPEHEKKAKKLGEIVSKAVSSFFTNDAEEKKNIAKQKAQEALDALKDVDGEDELKAHLKSVVDGTAVKNEDPKEPPAADPNPEPVDPVAPKAPEADPEPPAEDPNKSTTAAPVVDEEALKSKIIDAVTKSINDEQEETFKQVAKSLGSVLADTLTAQLDPIRQEIETLKSSASASKSLAGQEGAPVGTEKEKGKDGEEEDLWKGLISNSLPDHLKARITGTPE